jgi:AcrR family transcriptional regulator
MTRSSLTDRRKLETRYDIAKAAMSLFAEKGFDSVGAEEIAEEAGVSLRTFYRYFTGKDETLSPILAQGTANFAASIAARPAGEPLAAAVAAAYGETSASAGPGNVHTLILLLTDTPTLRARWLDHLRSIEESLVPVVRSRSPRIPEEDARLTAAAIVAALRVTLERSARTGSTEPLASEFEASLRFIGRGAHLEDRS